MQVPKVSVLERVDFISYGFSVLGTLRFPPQKGLLSEKWERNERVLSQPGSGFCKASAAHPHRCLLEPRGSDPGGVLAEKLGRGVRPASQNPYPIYDQNLRFSLPYL